ncbi:MAG: YafY family protein [Pseudomonadota bacterium]
MRRADRLMKIVHHLRRRRRAVTAQQIGAVFDVSARTVYRDIQVLMDAGVPIAGEAGVGYLIDKRYYLPPVTFDADELDAIALGMSMVRQWSDARFAAKADSAMAKIHAVLPAELQTDLEQLTTYAGPGDPKPPWKASLSDLRAHIRARDTLSLRYTDAAGAMTQRRVRPLALVFFAPTWLLVGWCEHRRGFRHFRLDRIGALEPTGSQFDDTPGTRLADYWAMETACAPA